MISAIALLATVAMTGVPDQVFFGGMEADACPEGRILSSDVHWDVGATLADVDLTQFENLWGRMSAADTPVAWPGVTGSTPTIEEFKRAGYIAAAFHTPSELSPTLVGLFKNLSYGRGPALDFSIGACGDFSSTLGACFVPNTPAIDQSMMHWRTEQPTLFYCVVAPDTDYYVNLRLTDPDDAAGSCVGDVCGVMAASWFGE